MSNHRTKKQLYADDSLDISVRVWRHAWNPYEIPAWRDCFTQIYTVPSKSIGTTRRIPLLHLQKWRLTAETTRNKQELIDAALKVCKSITTE